MANRNGKRFATSNTHSGKSDGPRSVPTFFTGLEDLEQRLLLSAGMPLGMASPSLVTAAAQGPCLVQLSWRSNDATASGFNILRSIDGGGFAPLTQLTSRTITSYRDTGVAPDHSYRYEVQAYNAAGSSDLIASAVVTTPPAAPTGLAAALANGVINLTWTDADQAAIGYYVFRSMDGGSYVQLTSIAQADATSYPDSAISAGHSYSYQVKAYTAGLTSAASTAAGAVTPLATPSAVAVVNSGAALRLSWTNNATTAKGYYVFRSGDSGKTFTKVATITTAGTTTYTDSGVSSSRTYQYRLQAYNAYSTSAQTDPAAGTTPLAVPTSVVVTLAGGKATLNWRNSDATVSGYYVFRAVDGAAPALVATIASAATLSYADSSVTTGHSYVYSVQAYSGDQRSSALATSAATVIPLVAPSSVAAALQGGAMNVTWTGNDQAAAGYRLYRSVDGKAYALLTVLASPTASAYLDSAVSNGHSYAYQVQAYNGVTTSAMSAAGTGAFPLIAPPSVSVSLSGGTVNLTWLGGDAGATGYYVWRSADSGKTFTKVGATNAATLRFADTAAAPSQAYVYQVQAYNAATTSGPSGTVSITTPLAAPTTLTVTYAGGVAKLTWRNADATVTGYAIYRGVDGLEGTLLTTVDSGGTLTYADTVASGHTYAYFVRATSGNRTSNASSAVSVVAPLVAPSVLTAVMSNNAIVLNWVDNDINATDYRIWRSVDGAAYTPYATAGSASAAGFTDTAVSSGHVYAYQVQAFDSVLASAVSAKASVTIPLAPPVNLALANGTAVNVTWTGADVNALGYYVYRSTDNKTFTKVGTVAAAGANSASYLDRTVSTGRTYYYRVAAYRGTVVSDPCQAASVTTPMLAPTRLAATDGGGNVVLTWTNADTSATGYRILRSADGANFTPLAQITSAATTRYVDYTVTGGQTYYYQVIAYNAVATSGVSATAAVGVALNTGGVTITTRYGNELVITASGSADSVTLDQNGSSLIVTADSQTYTFALPEGGAFVYTRGGSDQIVATAALTVRTTIVTIDGAATTVTSAGANVSLWVDSTDTVSGTGAVHSVAAYAGGIAKTVGASLRDPTPTSSTATTRKVVASLWGAGPVAGDENQGSVGDCYFMATLAAFAGTDPATLQESAVDMGDGTYVVRYYQNSQPAYVRVDNDFVSGGFPGGLLYANFGSGGTGDIWALVMEKAFCYIRTGANTFASIEGGWMKEVYSDLGVAHADFMPGASQSDFYTTITTDLAAHKPVTFACMSGPNLVNGHAYTLVSASKDAGGVAHYVVRNPWGQSGEPVENSQGYATLTYTQLVANWSVGTEAV